MNEANRTKQLRNDIDTVVGIAMAVVALCQAGLAGAVAELEDGRIRASQTNYLDFIDIFWTTFLLSATLTAAIASAFIPPALGWWQASWVPPVAILIGGALLTGLPVAGSGTPYGMALGALSTFAAYYGTAFVSGLIVGCAGGVIVCLVAAHFGAFAES